MNEATIRNLISYRVLGIVINGLGSNRKGYIFPNDILFFYASDWNDAVREFTAEGQSILGYWDEVADTIDNLERELSE